MRSREGGIRHQDGPSMHQIPRDVTAQQQKVPEEPAGRGCSSRGTGGAAALSGSVWNVNPGSDISGWGPTTSLDHKQEVRSSAGSSGTLRC